ncbi:MAG: hypothetical protein ABIB43_02395 [archaeon]
MVDDYELLPHEELEKLRSEIEHFKKNPYPGTKQNKNLLSAMEELNDSINRLIIIFEGTEESLINEYKDSSPIKVLKEISDQNRKIAEAILALASMLKGKTPAPITPPSVGPSRPEPMRSDSMRVDPMPDIKSEFAPRPRLK